MVYCTVLQLPCAIRCLVIIYISCHCHFSIITFHRMKSIVSVVEDKKRKQSTGRVPSCAKKPRVSKCAMYMYVIIHVLCIFCHLNLYMCVLYYM